MAAGNHSVVTHFILLGLTDRPEMQIPLFVVFLVVYIFTVVGNLGMIALVWIDPQLHTPMYFFLSNLSVVDLCYSSVFAPRMLLNLVESKTISYSACIFQHFSFVVFVTTEGFLLAAMAYDRYVAICNPLLYTVVMSRRVCIQLVVGSYIGGLINSLTHTCGLLRLSFCGPNVINHYFCDTNPLLKLTCSNDHINEILLVTFSGVIAMSTLLIVVISYMYILFSILRIHSNEGKRKAFSTCASHLTAVTMFYGPVSLSHVQPSSSYSLEQEKVSAVFYTLIVPMMNPLIYSMRNKEVKDSFKKMIQRRKCFQLMCL
ncbi:olfactory receptor-like protein COR8 [Alligator mississippiensis]|uniref:Olfactory receptor n=1 Tax=Alligator mississippiensis TaxID=8496 RepID=A0A151MUE0_ALLMI|nr:olfactory receptor-like protein COR8 [Alligator mississippiensis]KYO28117.1 olfactory receptor 5J2 [Alligator mississippiensis]